MNKHFLVSRCRTHGVDGAVLATCAINPMETLADVERDLKKMKVSGRVVFDLLLANGNKINRYFVGNFDGKHFTTQRFESAKAEYEVYSTLSATLLKEHASEVDPSLLSKAMQYAIRVGIPL